MFHVWDWDSEKDWGDEYVAWRQKYYGKNQQERFIDYMKTDAGKQAAADVGGIVNDYLDLVSAYYAFKQGHVGDGLFSLGCAVPLIGTPVFKGIKWLTKADNVTDALRLLNKGEFLKYTDELGNVLDIRKVDNGFEILDSTGTVLRRTDNLDEVTEAVEARSLYGWICPNKQGKK